MAIVFDWQTLFALIGAPVLRSVAGWLENALEDNKIDWPEWRLLASTIFRVGLVGLAAYLGFNGFGIDVSAFGAAFGAIVFDKIFFKKKTESKKK